MADNKKYLAKSDKDDIITTLCAKGHAHEEYCFSWNAFSR
ncbi:MAG: hypothetical protein K0R05_3546 [Anaerocolumna sp.]|jgi:hypothetical protein|nr:hypothetical protein [Anaerocolumna sp.]